MARCQWALPEAMVANPRYSKPTTCATSGCSLASIGWGYAPPAGPSGARLTFIGEALGYDEAIAGEAFYGSAGGVLSRLLHRAGIHRPDTRIGNVVNCFPGDVTVAATGVLRAFRRWYQGSLIRVETSAGILTGTPNHPVLTPRGWVPLGQLIERDHLIRGVIGQRMSGSHPDVDHPPASFEQTFEALALAGIRQWIIGSHVDFHGDGRKAEIEVVTFDRQLTDRTDTTPRQCRAEQILEATGGTLSSFVRAGACSTPRLDFSARWRTADSGPVRGGEHLLTFLLRGTLPSKLHDAGARAHRHIGSLQQSTQATLSDAELVRQALDAVPVPIETARVLKIERRWFSGHVYNLATLSEEYTANGFIVHNCHPPNDYLVGAPWEEHAISCCRQYLDPLLRSVPDDGVVVPLGGTALQSVLNLRGVAGIAVKDWHGTVTRDPTNRYWVVPTFHPSFLQRGAMNLLQLVTEDLRLADRVSQHGFRRSPCQLVVDPTPAWFAQWVADHLGRVISDPDGVHLSLDTEFAEKSGKDESEVTAWNAVSPMTRVNGASSAGLGWTVPYAGPYIAIIERLLAETAHARGWVWLWNKYADWDHLQQAGHTLDGIMAIDGMWLWHYLQSDVFRGLGFVAPCASDFGAWKHWSEDASKEGDYAAADGVQNWRTCMWCLRGATAAGLWDVFLRDWHDRDEYCLRPAHVQGVPIDRVALEEFHAENQRKLGSVLERIKETTARGVLRPKLGYRKPPGKKCATCKGTGWIREPLSELHSERDVPCAACAGVGTILSTVPPVGLLGKGKKGGLQGNEAKTQYMLEGVTLVEVEIEVEIRVCETCHAEAVGPKHRCPAPPRAKPRRHARRARRDRHAEAAEANVASLAETLPAPRPVARLVSARRLQRRWFWQLPFNPDAPAQIIQYLADKGIEAPVDKKTRRATTNKKALDALKAQHKDDPFFQLQLDWKAVQKVDATYAVGTAALLDADDRVHPEYLPIPSTLRDSARHPNLTNVVADKSGPQSLAAGFRRCVVARDGVPAGVTNDDLAAWEARWLR